MATVEVKERPILFSGPMVRALLSGAKTQTRRVLKLDAKAALSPAMRRIGFEFNADLAEVGDIGRVVAYLGGAQEPPAVSQQISVPVRHPEDGGMAWDTCGRERIYCPYGGPGDALWVRETFETFEGAGSFAKFGMGRVRYRADYDNGKNPCGLAWKPSIFMPRWACRLELEITSVRVERLQDITPDDARAEGVDAIPEAPAALSHRTSFAKLWDKLNAKRGFSWESNPWVWAITFSRSGRVTQ